MLITEFYTRRMFGRRKWYLCEGNNEAGSNPAEQRVQHFQDGRNLADHQSRASDGVRLLVTCCKHRQNYSHFSEGSTNVKFFAFHQKCCHNPSFPPTVPRLCKVHHCTRCVTVKGCHYNSIANINNLFTILSPLERELNFQQMYLHFTVLHKIFAYRYYYSVQMLDVKGAGIS